VDEALATAEQARKPDGPNGKVDLFKGRLLAAASRPLDQVEKALEAAAADPVYTLPARSQLVEEYLRHNDLKAAQGQLALLQKLSPKNPQTQFLDAVLAYAEKNYARASDIVDQLMRLAPDNPRLLVLGGAANLADGALIPAEAKLGRVVQTTQNARAARRMLAETYVRMGQPDKALSALQPLVEAKPPDLPGLSVAAQAHLMKGELDKAEALFQAVAAKRPDDSRIQTTLALIELDRGRATEAFDALRVIAERDTAGDVADTAAISSRLRRREYDQALAAIAALDKKRPGTPTVPYVRGLALAGKGDAAGARAAFDAALKLAPDYQAPLLELSRLDVNENDLEAARKRLAAWVQRRPTDTAIRLALLDIRLRQDAPADELLSAIDEAIRLAPTDPAPHLAKIIQTQRLKGASEAVLAAQTAMTAVPDNFPILDAAGVVFAADGQDEQAISAYNRMSVLSPNSPVPHLRLAELYGRRDNAGAAASNLERTFEVAPLAPDLPRYALAHAARFKDFKLPAALARRLQQRYPTRPEGFEFEGDTLAAQQQWGAAAAAFKLALARGSGTRLAIKTYDTLLNASPGRPGAEAFARDYLAKQPADAAYYTFLGERARFAKDYAAAERYYRQSLQLQPTHGLVMNNLGWVLGQLGRRAEGIALLDKALKLYHDSTSIMDTLAELLAADGYVDKAIEWQRYAVSVKPDDGSLKLNLAKLLLGAGHKQEARELLTALAQSKPNPPAQAEVQRLLKLAS
jgi:putative PEP-CTERM system TPR-repeat lipoprotein